MNKKYRNIFQKDNNIYEESNEIMTNILLVNCINPSIQNIQHSVPALKFCSSLREHIKKKLTKSQSISSNQPIVSYSTPLVAK